MADDTETLAARAEKADAELHEAIMEGAGPLATECQDLIMQLAAANARLERERDEARLQAAEAVVAVNKFDRERMAEARLRHSMEKQRDAATSALAQAEGERDALPRYRHVKRGTIYEIVLRCCLQLDGEHDMSPMVVYRDVADGSIWTRRQSEFFDGRFAALTPDPEAPNDGE